MQCCAPWKIDLLRGTPYIGHAIVDGTVDKYRYFNDSPEYGIMGAYPVFQR